MSKAILVTGSNGLLGSAILSKLKDGGLAVEGFSGDIQNEKSYTKYKNKKYDWIIHTAAVTDVNGCEKNRRNCFNVNITGTKNVRDLASKCGAAFLYISTASVFSGVEGNYNEEDVPNPSNFYNVSKFAGEIITSEYEKGTIVRTNIIGVHPQGSRGKNFFEWLLDSVKSNQDLNLFNDVQINPLSNCTLANLIKVIIESEKILRVVHLGSSNTLSKAQIGKFVIESEPSYTGTVKFVSIDKVMKDLNRPKNMTINCSQTEKELGIAMPRLEDEINLIFKELKS
ncbi:SDR family oxidoreductase [Candidatus Kaiserbacteria bacterium]|nr:SDR family oxidoreductase [Candidatus Kaiserbacteria bacterium]